jgi:predicted NUDIX family NTP pyrophosphohydrolase
VVSEVDAGVAAASRRGSAGIRRIARWDGRARAVYPRPTPYHPAMPRLSAGILLYRRGETGLEVLLAHPGGPVWKRRDDGAWSIPKGEPDGAETGDLLAVARREFEEETGQPVPDRQEPIPLGSIRQKGGKVVHAWAIEGDLDPQVARSNMTRMEWPPRSGRWVTFPEIDRVEWFGPDEAKRRIKDTQAPLVDRLVEHLGTG